MDLITVLALLTGCLMAQLNISRKPLPQEASKPTDPANVQMLKALLSACLDPKEVPPS